jgi:hypothetical protein
VPSRAPAPSRRRTVLELAAGLHRRPADLLASLTPSEARAVACLPAFHPHAAVHRAAAVTAAGRRRPTPHLPSGSLPTLGEHVVLHGRLPGRDRRRLVGFGRTRAALPGRGPNCYDLSFVRVLRVKSRA